MSGKELLTREDLLKDTFNNSKIDTKDVKKFLLYFGVILQIGVSEGLIDEARRNFIANAITNAIEAETTDEDEEEDTNYVQIRNYMYIVSSYLQSKSNWNAWLEVSSITNIEDAFTLIANARKWFEEKLADCKDLLSTTKFYVLKLDLKNLTHAYNILANTIKNTISSMANSTNFDLQDYHATTLSTGEYILLMNGNELHNVDNFIINLCNTIHSFDMEVSILFNVNAKELFKGKKGEADLFFANSYNTVAEVDRIYRDKLSNLKKEYDKNLKKCDDKVELDREYSSAKYALESEWEEQITKIEEELQEEEILQMENLSGEYSLSDFVKEYAIYKMAYDGKISYPSTMKKRSAMLMMIDQKQAMSEFISGNEQVLTIKQIEYLKKIA